MTSEAVAAPTAPKAGIRTRLSETLRTITTTEMAAIRSSRLRRMRSDIAIRPQDNATMPGNRMSKGVTEAAKSGP